MSRLVKLATSAGLSVASLGLMASSAFASTTILNTGDFNNFNLSHTTTTSITVHNQNTANIWQSAFSVANTGGNTANNNILGGSIHTGNAGVANFFSVNANSNWTNINVH